MKVDTKSFDAADAAFGGLTKSALQLGAVLASKLAIDKMVGDFKNAGTELNNFNKLTGMSTQNVQLLGQAIKAQGGSAADAFSDLTKLQDLMASPITGNVGWFGDVAKLGLNPDVIIGAQDTADALANIAKEFEHMTPLNQRLAASALGLSESTTRLAMQGEDAVRRQLDTTGKLAVMTGEQIKDAARLTEVSSELDRVFDDIGTRIGGKLTPAISEMGESMVKLYRSNKEVIDSGIDKFFGSVAENIELVTAALLLLGGAGALKGIAALRSIVGLGGAAGAGAGAAGGVAARSLLVNPMTAGAAALLYSSSLNEGEDTDLLNNRLKKGGGEAVGATVDFFMKKGWSREQAEGVAANLEQESGFKANAVGDGGNAYGMAQWHPDRQAEFAKQYGKDIRKSTGAEQLEFINHELTIGKEKSAGGKLRAATSAYDAASIVSREYERPADKEGEADRRGQAAAGYTDNRQFHIHGADVGKVKQIINEQMSGLTEKTMQDFRSPEK